MKNLLQNTTITELVFKDKNLHGKQYVEISNYSDLGNFDKEQIDNLLEGNKNLHNGIVWINGTVNVELK